MTTATDAPEMQTFADAEAVLAEALPGYQPRPPQQRLAKQIEDILDRGGFLLAQAGTGVGKSLGYAIPAILSGQRVVIATATKALQDQIGDKDLPFLREYLPVDFEFAILKGRSNYLCERRLDLSTDLTVQVKEELAALAKVPGVRGERDRMQARSSGRARAALDDWRIWADICSDTDECGNCVDHCSAARARAKEADLLIVNHALLVFDAIVGNAITAGYQAVVVDEAHELESYATSALEHRMTSRGAINTCSQMHNVLGHDEQDKARSVDLFTRAFDLLPVDEKWGNEHRIYHGTIINDDAISSAWADALDHVSALVAPVRRAAEAAAKPDVAQRLAAAARRGDSLVDSITALLVRPDHEVVRWTEVETRGKGRFREEVTILRSAPINPGDDLRRLLWNRVDAAVLTSATVTVGDSMDHVAGRLGFSPSKRLAEQGVKPLAYETLDVGTPFDYSSNAVLCVPRNFPAPSGRTKNAWQSESVEAMRQMVEASGGRALLLFTSISEMKSAKRMLSRTLPFPMKMQGEDSTKALAEWFEDNETAVLLATRTFFTGVDFKGDTLRLVVLNKVPFPRYGEPLSEARQEAVEELPGKSGFMDYYVPEAILPMKQAFGRLIRTHTDKGVVAVLDSRIHDKGYGRTMLRSMPDARRTSRVDEAISFLGSL